MEGHTMTNNNIFETVAYYNAAENTVWFFDEENSFIAEISEEPVVGCAYKVEGGWMYCFEHGEIFFPEAKRA